MTLEQLIERQKAQIAERVALRKSKSDEIAAIRESLTDAAPELTPENEVRAAAAATARDSADAEITQLSARLAELEREKASDDAATRLQNEIASAPVARAHVESEPNPVYRKDGEQSFFRDLYGVTRGERAAQDRLVQSQERAGTTATGAGGEFAPPAWLVSDFVTIARAGRVTADLMNSRPLPSGVSSINIPKLSGNTTPDVTQTQNTTITESAVTSTSISSGITEISGKQTVSIALLRQSGNAIDQVILQDLAAAYAVTLDIQVIRGTGANGQLRGLVTSGTNVAFTTTVPAVVSATAANNFYGKVVGAKDKVDSSRLLPATAIVMHSRRWNWILAGQDSTLRPIVAPAGVPTLNGIGTAANGFSGHTLAGLPVFIDSNIDGTTEQVFVMRTDDLWLWESPPELASFDATLAAQNSILFRVLGFAAFIPDRYNYASANVAGTGLAAPTF